MSNREDHLEPAGGAENPQFRRVAAGDRAAVSFSFGGLALEAREGDTVLTALLTSRRWLRGFEFGAGHRSGFCLMGACQDCWLHEADGMPIRACTTLVRPGMRLWADRT